MFLWVNGAGEVMSGCTFPSSFGKEIRVFSQFQAPRARPDTRIATSGPHIAQAATQTVATVFFSPTSRYPRQDLNALGGYCMARSTSRR